MFNNALLAIVGGKDLSYTHRLLVSKSSVDGVVFYGYFGSSNNLNPTDFDGVTISRLTSATSDGSSSDMLQFSDGVNVGNSIKITRLDSNLEAIYTFANGAYYSSTPFITESDWQQYIYLIIELV